jgi:hypothetical protein
MTRYKVILPVLLLVAVTSRGLAAAGRYAISTEQIAATVNRFGIEVAPDQVKLLSGVVATTADPRLTVRSVHSWGSERLMARLECESREQCLPFFVGLEVVRGNGSTNATGLSKSGAEAQPSATPTAKDYVLRKGSPATLQIDSDRVHIRVSVICLENGVQGQTIRVTSKDHRIVYSAQVVDGGLLQGRL